MGDVIESIISEAYKAYDPPKTGSAKEQTGPTKMTHLQQHVLAYEKMIEVEWMCDNDYAQLHMGTATVCTLIKI